MGKSNQVVGSMSEWSGVLKDLFRQIRDGSITLSNLQAFLEHRDPFKIVVQPGIVANIDLAKAYEACGMANKYVQATRSFDMTDNNDVWELIMVKELTVARLFQGYKNVGVYLCSCCNDLDTEVAENDRDPNRDGSYAVSFRRTAEADEHTKKDCKSITLHERLILGLSYFLKTGDHLDKERITKCAGSHSLCGDVPTVYWNSRYSMVYVNRCSPAKPNDKIRDRSVVSDQP